MVQDSKPRVNPIYPAPAGALEKPPDLGPPVRGWLLYYCISRTILGPLFLLYTFHTLHLFRLIAIDIIEAVVGFAAGLEVWRMSRRWVPAVWCDLAVRLLQAWIIAASWQAVSATQHHKSWGRFVVLIWGLLLILGWLLYFKRSRRVFQTLGRNL